MDKDKLNALLSIGQEDYVNERTLGQQVVLLKRIIRMLNDDIVSLKARLDSDG